MTRIAIAAVLLGLATAPVLSARDVTVKGTYVEARTAEVFTGGCIMNAEAGTQGREAVLAWKVDKGRFNGVTLDGLAVVAAVSADVNLGIHEIGGEIATTRTAVLVDERATPAQQKALVAMAKALSKGVVNAVVDVSPVAIQFLDFGRAITVNAKAARLTVQKDMAHDPTCGSKQWFEPLSMVDGATMGTAADHVYSGTSLGLKWSDPNKRSAFFGTFSY